MSHKSTPTGIQNTIDIIIKDLCSQHQGDSLEEDIIALFEDIIRFFSGREEDFLSFDELTMDQKEEIYNEITTITNLLKKLGESVDRNETIKILSTNLVQSFSKKSRGLLKYNDKISEVEQERLKKEFSIITIQELYKKRQEQNFKQPPRHAHLGEKELKQIANVVDKIRNSGTKFSSIVRKKSTIIHKGM